MKENIDSMIATSLQLEEPWYVSGASYDPEKQEIDIWVKVRDNAEFACQDADHRRSGMGMSRMNGHGDMRTACSFLATSTASAPRYYVGSAVHSRSTPRSSEKAAASA